MSKIEELAKEYCKIEHLKGSSFDDISMMKPAYITGANAVLKEIENVLYSPITPYQLYNDLDKLVKELKGE